jgi:amidophosphoribosyltransferase
VTSFLYIRQTNTYIKYALYIFIQIYLVITECYRYVRSDQRKVLMCGIIGVFGNQNAAKEAYQGLLVMQHRGQDAAGILSYDFDKNSYHLHKDQGLVDQVFTKDNLNILEGQMAIGHTRYSTIGKSKYEDIQPIFINFPYGMGLVHNGNLINAYQLKQDLKTKSNRYIVTNNDVEVMANIIAQELAKHCMSSSDSQLDVDCLAKAVKANFDEANGAYSVIGTLAGQGMFAFRDPQGIRPLVMGTKNESFCFASESNALSFLDYKIERSLLPGELIYINKEGKFFSKQLIKKKQRSCMFEWVYFANPESLIDNTNVYESRIKMGEILGEKIQGYMQDNNIALDAIVPVPDTSRVSAIRASEISQVRYRELLIKNRYVQRSFILNDQEARERAVKLKLSPIKHELKGKNVVLIDDSIVRGTTSKRLIELVRKAGANKVFFASACPPILWPCYYGIDFPTKQELVAHNRNTQQIAEHLGADGVIYLDVDELKQAINRDDLCLACVNGQYPTGVTQAAEFNRHRVSEDIENEYHPH